MESTIGLVYPYTLHEDRSQRLLECSGINTSVQSDIYFILFVLHVRLTVVQFFDSLEGNRDKKSDVTISEERGRWKWGNTAE